MQIKKEESSKNHDFQSNDGVDSDVLVSQVTAGKLGYHKTAIISFKEKISNSLTLSTFLKF